MQTQWCRKDTRFYSSAKPANQINQTKRSGAQGSQDWTFPLSLYYFSLPFFFFFSRALPRYISFYLCPLDACVTRAVRDKNEKSRSPLIVINSAFIIIKIDRRASRNPPFRPSFISQPVVLHSASLSVRYNIYKKRTYNTGYTSVSEKEETKV